MREFAVTEAIPQNSCAPMMTSSISLPVLAPRASMKICAAWHTRVRLQGAAVGLDREGQAEEQHESGRPGHDDRADDPLRPLDRGVLRLLRHVGGRVIAGEGVLRHQETDERDVDRRAPAGVVDELGEHKTRGLVLVGNDQQGADDHHDADQMPPHRDRVEEADDAHAEGVHHGVQQKDHTEERDRVGGGGGVAELKVQVGVEERRGAEVDARGDGHLPERVEPAGEPGPGRSGLLRGEFVRPEIEAAWRSDRTSRPRPWPGRRTGSSGRRGPSPT